MDFRHLETLVALAEESHFGRAARRLHVVQSAVTRTIQALEEEVGTALFLRDKRRVLLTSAGEALLQRARAILDATNRAARECREVGQGKLGTLRVAFSGLSGLGSVPEALAAFRGQHPSVAIELSCMSSAEQVVALCEGEIDVALSHVALDDDRIRIDRLKDQRLFALLPEGHPLASGRTVSFSELEWEAHVVLARSVEPEVFRSFSKEASHPGRPPPTIIEVEDVSLMFALVAAGLGVSHLPEDAIRLGFRGVIALPIEPAVQVTLFAARLKQATSPLGGGLVALLTVG